MRAPVVSCSTTTPDFSALRDRRARLPGETFAPDAVEVPVQLEQVASTGHHFHAGQVADTLGGDPGAFRSRRFAPPLADDADLVLTMTSGQRRSVLETAPLGLRRTFALPEVAALLPLADLTPLERLALRERVAEVG